MSWDQCFRRHCTGDPLKRFFFATPIRCSATANDRSFDPAIDPDVSHRPSTPMDGVPWTLYPTDSAVACFALVATTNESSVSIKRVLSTPCLAAKSPTSSGLSRRWRSTWMAAKALRCSCSTRPSASIEKNELLVHHERHLSERDRNATEQHAGGEFLLPRVHRRFKRIAMRTAIRKELQYLHLLGVAGGLPWRDRDEVRAFDRSFLGSGEYRSGGKCRDCDP